MDKKGAGWLSWVLVIALFISVGTTMILWAQTKTTEATESAMSESERKMQCADVKIKVDTEDCSTITVENRGLINIYDLEVWADNTKIEDTGAVIVQDSITLNNLGTPDIITVVPKINVNGESVSCKAKRLTIEC